ncbi:MAG: endolytic transglycosylase MltG [Alphaproteobacteria bacterium]|nr:endolytic transglycosylase MltG [Alphaproteobacteria bacterium]
MNEPLPPDQPEPVPSPSQDEPAPAPQDSAEQQPKSEPAAKKKTGRLILLLAAFVALLLPVFAALAVFMPLPIAENKTIIVPHGTPVQAIAATIQESGVPLNPYIFRLAALLLANNNLKAGEYQLTPEQTMDGVIAMMREGNSIVRMLTIPEGLTSREIVTLLRNDPMLSGEIADIPPEGTLLPETYRYSYGDARTGLIERMQKSLQEQLDDMWEKRETGLPLKSPQEALVMASIIEKETGKKAGERARVAGVFYNRLKQDMRLQSDPTVIYAITKGEKPLDRSLRRDDLAFASPYNTYIYTGLPPGPISNPGRASLEAALHPEKNDFLYFVADGTGGHAFAKDLTAHNKNVNHWLSPPSAVPVPKKKPKP